MNVNQPFFLNRISDYAFLAEGMGHQWPLLELPVEILSNISGATSQNLYATKVIVEFFLDQ
jgi:poly(3-hydroxybutyrate) depolymerase